MSTNHATRSAFAPGKVILFGEHAVVYGQPAIAVPVTQVKASATVTPASPGSGLTIVASDLGADFRLDTAPPDEPLTAAARLTLFHCSTAEPDATLTLRSTIPIASGLGSGTAVSTALIRALAEFLGCPMETAGLSALVFEIEKIHHGTPSGIDNTVIAYQKPVYYRKGTPYEFLEIGEKFSVLIAYSGMPGNTREAVEGVRERWQKEPDRYNQIFSRIGEISQEAKVIIETGNPDHLGSLMNENHELLQEIGVSTPELDQLVFEARNAGALGAKLSGGGLGGHIIALVKSNIDFISGELEKKGAISTLITPVTNRNSNR